MVHRAHSGYPGSSSPKLFLPACSKTLPASTRYPSTCFHLTTRSWMTRSRRRLRTMERIWKACFWMELGGTERRVSWPSRCQSSCRTPCPLFLSYRSGRTSCRWNRHTRRLSIRRARGEVCCPPPGIRPTLWYRCGCRRIGLSPIGSEEVFAFGYKQK